MVLSHMEMVFTCCVVDGIEMGSWIMISDADCLFGILCMIGAVAVAELNGRCVGCTVCLL